MVGYALGFIAEPVGEDALDQLMGLGISVESDGVGWIQVNVFAEADSFKNAALQALDILESNLVRVLRMDLDLVNRSAIASRAEVSRATVTRWVNGELDDAAERPFPNPWTVTEFGSIWTWAQVNRWLSGRKGVEHDDYEIPDALQVSQFNTWFCSPASDFSNVPRPEAQLIARRTVRASLSAVVS
jgi:hypothetical protein